MNITNADDLCKYVGVESTDVLKRAVYKAIACGPWVVFEDGCVKVGSIVEGVDQTTETHTLTYPFDSNAWDMALEAVEKEADEIWHETHGCESCGSEDEFGHRPINPDCPMCHGNGTII